MYCVKMCKYPLKRVLICLTWSDIKIKYRTKQLKINVPDDEFRVGSETKHDT